MKRPIVLGIAVLGVLAVVAPSTGRAAAPAAFLQDSALSGSGGTITITRLPIQLSNGKFIFKDVTIPLATDNTGTLSLGALVQAASPPLPSRGLRPGLYGRSDNTNERFQLSGPFAGPGGTSKYTIVTASNAPCGSPAVIYVGPLNQNPLQPRLGNAGITSTEYSYGVVQSGQACGNPWLTNYVVGVAQLGDEIQVASFTNGGTDQNSPVTSYTYLQLQ